MSVRLSVFKALVASLWLAVPLGCGTGPTGPGAGGAIELLGPIPIPAGSAHTIFQGGRQVAAATWLEPYCELEIRTVSQQPQEASPGRVELSRPRVALLKDPISRVPALVAGFSCSDPLYRESLWFLRGGPGTNLHSLRCIRPGFHCRVPLPLGLGEAATILGPTIRVLAEGG